MRVTAFRAVREVMLQRVDTGFGEGWVLIQIKYGVEKAGLSNLSIFTT
ncbi:MAG TPA: hypothetical protein VHU83_23455 [Bryobacteraceae bacterium]|nr:hypothetical protein [Bryobacteraceae bacterium]